MPGTAPRITSLLIKPASAVCNLDCAYCFYLDREADPYKALPARRMTLETLERLVDTYLFYSYPNSIFAFQGGEPTLAGLPFFEKLVEYEQQHGRGGQAVSNALQTNGMLLDEEWCRFFAAERFGVGLSLDGPADLHDRYRLTKGHGTTHAQTLRAYELLRRYRVPCDILCVVHDQNVRYPTSVYRFFREIGASYLGFLPLVEPGVPCPLLTWPERSAPVTLESDGARWVPVGTCRTCQFCRGVEGKRIPGSPGARAGVDVICTAPVYSPRPAQEEGVLTDERELPRQDDPSPGGAVQD